MHASFFLDGGGFGFPKTLLGVDRALDFVVFKTTTFKIDVEFFFRTPCTIICFFNVYGPTHGFDARGFEEDSMILDGIQAPMLPDWRFGFIKCISRLLPNEIWKAQLSSQVE